LAQKRDEWQENGISRILKLNVPFRFFPESEVSDIMILEKELSRDFRVCKYKKNQNMLNSVSVDKRIIQKVYFNAQ
jgi:hypothetical protein